MKYIAKCVLISLIMSTANHMFLFNTRSLDRGFNSLKLGSMKGSRQIEDYLIGNNKDTSLYTSVPDVIPKKNV